MPKDDNHNPVDGGVKPNRKAAGSFVKKEISGLGLSLKAFCNLQELAPYNLDFKALHRITAGRKKIDPLFAEAFTIKFGKSIDFWLTLEVKILNKHFTKQLYLTDYEIEKRLEDPKDKQKTERIEQEKLEGHTDRDGRPPRVIFNFRAGTVEVEQDVEPDYLDKLSQHFGWDLGSLDKQ